MHGVTRLSVQKSRLVLLTIDRLRRNPRQPPNSSRDDLAVQWRERRAAADEATHLQGAVHLLRQPRYPRRVFKIDRARRPEALRPHLSVGLPTARTMHKALWPGKGVESTFRNESSYQDFAHDFGRHRRARLDGRSDRNR